MSYCRFSSKPQSDVYVYAHVSGGWITHVAGDIKLPYKGKEFNHDTPKECSDNLIILKEAGYNVPQYAIDRLIKESNPPEDA